MAAKNVLIIHIWDLATGQGSPLTGLAGNMSTTMNRYSDASTQAAATETVTIAEIGSTGFYSISYTPTQAELYKGVVEESSLDLIYTFEDNVLDVPEATVADNAYCTEADVIAWTQAVSDYTTTTQPTQTEVLFFMETRAAELYGILVEEMGTSAVGPSGATNYSTEIDTSSDIGFAMGRVLRMANAVGAAMDALEAGVAGETPARSERITELGNVYAGYEPTIRRMAKQYLGAGSQSETHVSSGEITLPTVVSREQPAMTFNDSTKW